MKKIISYITLLVFIMQLIAGCKSTDTAKKPTSPSINSERTTSSTTDEQKANKQDSVASVKLSLNLPVANVDIIDYETSTQPKGILINTDVTWPDGSTAQRKLEIKSRTSDLFDVGTKLSLTDDANTLLYEYVFEMDTTGSDFRITERTLSDEMVMEYSVSSGTMTESYIINEERREFTYPEISEEDKNATFDYYNHFKNSKEAMAKMLPGPAKVSQEYLQALESFEKFYLPSVNNTLHNNREGELLTDFMTNEDFVSWLEETFSVYGNSKLLGIPKKACNIAGTCSALKCWFFGLENPVCLLCSIGATVCVIAKLFNQVS